MNRLLNFTKWAFSGIIVIALVLIYSCSDDPEPVEAPAFSYAPTSVEVGETGSIMAASQGGAATFALKDVGDADFVTINSTTGELTIAAESTTGTYNVIVTGTNESGSADAIASITITVNSDFDPSGKSMYWKYWMNNTEDIIMENLNTLPGQGDLPPAIPIPVGWPGGVPFQINPLDPALESYLVFPTVQFFTLQVPGDETCGALDPREKGDTLLLIVNNDLSLSTLCRDTLTSAPGTTVDIGSSTISYSGDAFTWTLSLTIMNIPVSIPVGEAKIEDFTDPLDPSWFAPSGQPRTFSAVTGNVPTYMALLDLAAPDPLTAISFLDVDVVLEILP
jgi:PKD repeat protein